MTIEEKKALAQAAIDAGSSCAEFKAAAQNYIDALGTSGEKAAAAALVAEAKEDINLIDDTIAFLKSEMAVKIFGAELAPVKLAEAEAHKANGGIYCDCPGCAAAEAIINAEAEL